MDIQSVDEQEPVGLATVNPKQRAPYHLINAALNIPGTQRAEVRDRLCDFFLFSKHFTGSPATGYFSTKDWKANARELDLATAMAVSGAAFSSHMGLGSMPSISQPLARDRARNQVRDQPKDKAGHDDADGDLADEKERLDQLPRPIQGTSFSILHIPIEETSDDPKETGRQGANDFGQTLAPRGEAALRTGIRL